MWAQSAISGDEITDQAFRLMVDGVEDYAIVVLTPQGAIASWNTGAEHLKGYSADEVLGLDFFAFFFREDGSETSVAEVRQELDITRQFWSEGWCRRKDGTRFWAHLTIQKVVDELDHIIGYTAICRDRTTRRSAEDVSRRNEERFRQLIEGFRDHAICMLDVEGRIGSWSSDLERLLGYCRSEIVGAPFSALFPAHEQPTAVAEKLLETALRQGRLHNTGWLVHRDGHDISMSEIIDVIYGETGDHTGFAVVMRDISAQQATEQALLVARRALFQSQKLEMIGKLTGGVAHDFNNLLSAILGNLELSRKLVGADGDAGRFIENAVTGANRGAALVARMMNFTRGEVTRATAVALPELLLGVEELVSRSLGANVAIETDCPANVLPIMADPQELELALMNLIVNARDAMPDGGTIQITAQNEGLAHDAAPRLAAAASVRLTVRDTGTGMDCETLARAVDLFFTTKEPGKGTGMGLSMVQSFVDAAHGRMSIESLPGKGTAVFLLLPAALNAGSRVGGEDEGKDEDLEVSATRRLRVLVVDDDALVLMNTVAMLAELGHETLEAGSAEDALDLLDTDGEDRIDLLITDHAMPRFTGLELGKIVCDRWPRIPVVLASGYAEDVMQADGIAKAWLRKPFGLRELRGVIDTVALQGPAGSSQMPAPPIRQ